MQCKTFTAFVGNLLRRQKLKVMNVQDMVVSTHHIEEIQKVDPHSWDVLLDSGEIFRVTVERWTL